MAITVEELSMQVQALEARRLVAARVDHAPLDRDAEPAAVYRLERNPALLARDEVAALGVERHVVGRRVTGQPEVPGVVVAHHQQVAGGALRAVEPDGLGPLPAPARLPVRVARGAVGELPLPVGPRLPVAEVDAAEEPLAAVLPLEGGRHLEPQRVGVAYAQRLLEEVGLARAVHEVGVGHERVVALGYPRVERHVPGVNPAALHHLDPALDRVVGRAQLDVHVLARGHRLVGGRADDEPAEPHRVAAHVVVAVGGQVYLLLRELVALLVEPRKERVGKPLRPAQRYPYRHHHYYDAD